MAYYTLFNKETTDKIIDEMIIGKSLNRICKEEGMPNRLTVIKWVSLGKLDPESQYAEFAQQYELAQELRQELHADEINELAEETVPPDVVEQGNAAIHAWTNRQRLRVDTLKWTASRLLSKRYGDKIQHTGEDGGPIVTQIERIIVHEKTPKPEDTDSAGL